MGALAPGDRLHSLRWRLLLATGMATLLVWCLAGILSYGQARKEAEELMDGHLAQSARVLLALVRDNESHLADISARLERGRTEKHGVYEPPLEFQIGTGDGIVLLRSPDAPRIPLLGLAGYIDIERDNQSWRLLNVVAPGGDYRVQVAQPMQLRERAALEVASQTVLPVGIILPALLLLLYLSIRRGLRPLDELAADVAARSPENLAPLPARPVPLETRPLVRALNRLLSRLGETLENERRFTADAAHELSTPLAAIKVQAQVALMSSDPQVLNHALRQVQAGVDRSSRLVAQLLRLARLDPLASPTNLEPVNLAELAQETARSFPSANTAGHPTITVASPDPGIAVEGDRDLLAAALRNLVENAVRYAPACEEITIAICLQKGVPRLAVLDDGPGVPPDELVQLAERFYRGRSALVEGSGLGLAIVRRIAELHGARLELANRPEGGFVASLCWNQKP